MMLGPRKGMIFIVSAPSGAGKTTLVTEVIAAFQNEISRVVTCTTRVPRKGEVHGKDYLFLSEEEFEKKRVDGEFLESTRTYDHSYGTLKKSVEDLTGNGNAFLVIDVKGALSIMKELDCVTIFISPPTLEELEKRIRNRMQDSDYELNKRIQLAEDELEKASFYDYHLVNDDFSVAVEIIKSIIIAESFRSRRNG
jgi:guanylate kinase